MPGRVVVPKIIEEVEHPWVSGELSVNGVQWDTQQNVNADATFFAFGRKAFNSIPDGYAGSGGELLECDVGLTFAAKSDNGDAIVHWYAQGRELINTSADKPWVDLCTEQVQTSPINAAWQESTIRGMIIPQANFNTFPVEVRVLANMNAAQGELRMKNSSYVRYRYVISRERY